MKRVIFLLIICLLFLSACSSPKPTYEELEEKIYKYENEIAALNTRIENIYYDISQIGDAMSTLYVYFDEQSISFDEAYNAYDDIHNRLRDFYQ